MQGTRALPPGPLTLRQRSQFVWNYLKRHPRALAAGLAAMLSRDAVSFTFPLLIREGVNNMTHAPGVAVRLSLPMVCLGMMAVAVLRSGFQTMTRLSLMNTSREAEYAIRKDLLGHVFRLDASFWGRTRVGDVMALATNDLNAVRMMLGPGLSSLFESVVSLPVAFTVMASVDWRLAVMALLPAPLAALCMIRYGHIIRTRFVAIQALFSNMSAAVQQTIAGVRVVRAFVREGSELRRFDGMNRSYVNANRVLAMYSGSFDPMLTFFAGLSLLAVLWYGGHEVLDGRLNVGTFVMFTSYMAMLVRPISSLGRVVNLMQRGLASVGRLLLLFRETPGIAAVPGRAPVPLGRRAHGAVTFEDVGVLYSSSAALDSIDLEVPAGSTVAVLGATGAGKSTLVRLIPRLLDPTRGRVLIDGVDCRNLSLDELRALVGVVPQETFLFSATLAENIALGAPQATGEDIRQAAEIAGLAPDLAAWPEGYDTVVGERGVMLSGGQRQRIAIARAILKNPRILILDDALSSVDALTERGILQHLKHIMAERTTFLISHRVATAMNADLIVVLGAGRVIEQGSHESLLAHGGYYARLSRLQALQQELEAM